MPEWTQDVTNTEVIADEEEVVTSAVDEEEDEEEDEVDPRDAKIAELEEKNAKLYNKLKGWYKKHVATKEVIKQDFVSKDDVKNLIREVETEKQQEQNLINTFDDAAELMDEINKVKSEKGLNINEAYALVKGKMMSDENYRNQINQTRTQNHWSFIKTELKSKADSIFAKWPKISMKSV